MGILLFLFYYLCSRLSPSLALRVNLAGLFVLEPLISPSLFQRYPQAVDEWSLSVAMSNDPASGGLGQIEAHYKTFITEKDIAEIAGAGLTWVRLPIGFWAIETFPGEPFLAKTSWNYVIRVLQWCRKYGLRVNLVLNAVPGSQNGFNHGGKRDSLNFLNGVMGMANAQRTLYYIRVLAEFISQPEWVNVVPMLSILNEPLSSRIGTDQLRSFYVEAHRIIREITGYGKGLGPFVVIDSGFQDPSSNVFNGFMNGADRVVIENHVYLAFSEVAMESVAAGTVRQFCSLGASMDRSRSSFGITVAGAFSPAFLDCGLFVNGVGDVVRYKGDCSFWENSTGWGLALKASLTQLVLAQMDALGDYFFFTWKVGVPTIRFSLGACKAVDEAYTPTWDGTYSAWMTGGDGAFVATDAAQYPWPPGTISNTGTSSPTFVLPTYTATGSPITLPAPTFTDTKGKAIVLSHGSPLGRVPAPTLVAGCDYPDAWNALNANFTQAVRRVKNFNSASCTYRILDGDLNYPLFCLHVRWFFPLPKYGDHPAVSAENQRNPDIEVESPPPYPANAGFDHAGTYPPRATPRTEERPSRAPSVHDPQDLSVPPKANERRWWLDRRALLTMGLVILAISVAACAIFPPVYLKVIKPRNNRMATRGGNGSPVLMEDGTEFVYLNSFGGFWVHDPENPYDDSAQPNSWTPALKEPWKFESHRIHGVNLGGAFVLENLTATTLFQKYPQAVDEWTLSLAMANDPDSGGLNQIEEHYRTFITEQDLAEIAGAGLTWVRIPIGFWAIETFPGEPFLARTSWKYIVRVLQWCRKYGLRVNLSLYTVPGSAQGTPDHIPYPPH
ncbi:hypothetical protein EST38_g2666 [Candolleomyces aberdarensis]|uniref:glucan 1,3-beta-glucosidase n=1 Tax=Candolleomyces aberdarensis TaxID=2316362 RepID=A0A4Q2DVG9_9AGAR|nr:hypothetical protein EST38_g2666 [Candolleomyces aberdarensis]